MISSGAIAKDHIICRGKNYADKGVREDDHDAVGVKLRVPCRKQMREPVSEPASEPDIEEEDDDSSRGHWELQNPFSVPDAEDEKEARRLDE